jgi:hypothetical protein
MVLVGTGAGSGPTAILGAPLREGTKEFQLPLEMGGRTIFEPASAVLLPSVTGT